MRNTGVYFRCYHCGVEKKPKHMRMDTTRTGDVLRLCVVCWTRRPGALTRARLGRQRAVRKWVIPA